ncbi:MAG: ABC transporter substrate binding protein [Amphritea sp.]
MRRIKRIFNLILLTTAMLIGSASAAVNQSDILPQTKDGAKWRLAYYQGGEYVDYHQYLVAAVRGFMALGWIEQQVIPVSKIKDTASLWRWMSQELKSDFIEFVDDAYYSAGWNNEVRNGQQSEFIDRLNVVADIDMVIAMGTWAGKDLANNLHSTPTIILSASDPVRSGVVKSLQDSGFDHVFVSADPGLFEQQIRIFHDFIGFKRLGVAFEDTVDGRSYAAIELVEKVARERGFQVIACHTLSDIPDQQQAGQSVIDCFRQLSENVDAIYVTVQGGVNTGTIFTLMEIANKRQIPTFSQSGEHEVKYGSLLSLSKQESFNAEGLLLSKVMARVLNGANPRYLKHEVGETSRIVLNLKTAEMIGLYLSADVLAAADRIYRQIEKPKD